ncbi:polysaccharide lyase family 8 super-sandwich domain-containing protein [Streptomyces sp. SBT349]|uniref:polysaccharide lyase family 8 super-sandwich domain-containing protein n=1 Tax=Streptomyces sp. SBT349 TaxID=1580539 RepID=UPI00066E8B6C|nr:polysaccharide lyase family 8 super-sandwich domain-containing protein [Streptomyces sp. SBT349]
MRISRRALLTAFPAAGLVAGTASSPAWAAARPGGAPAGAAAPAGTAEDRALLIANTTAIFAGTADSNARPEVAAKLASIEATAVTRLAAMDGAGPGELFRDLPLGTSDGNLNASFQYLYEIALATCVPGDTPSRLRGDAAVRRRVIDGLRHLHDTYYGDQARGYYGNWFNWEIGISAHVSKTLLLLRDDLAAHAPDLTAAYAASMDAYLRNGKDGDVDLGSRFHTGANLADITTNRILQGAVLDDDARVTKAVADQLTVYATVDPYDLRHGVTDGFYADGSFIQHASVAYTGSYGTALLSRVVQTIKVLEGTGYLAGAGLPAAGLVGVVHGWVADGFAPVVFEGWMMEIVRGRAVSRTTTGYAAVATVVEAVTDLSGHATGADATALEGYLKYVRETSPVAPDPSAFVSPVTTARYADILASSPAPAADLNPPERHAAFNAMDKTVHRRPGYAFAVARSSTRISKYEYMNGENLRPWFQGDGAHYLYLAGEDQTQVFGVDYYTTVSPYRLAGVTTAAENRLTVPELYGGFWYDNPEAGFTSSSESQNTYVYFPRGTHAFSGGASLGAYGAAGLVQSDDAAYAARRAGGLPGDFVAYRNAGVTKSWFMFDEEIVLLAAGVGDAEGRAVTSTLDTRIADPADGVELTGELRDGTAWSGTGTAPLAWLRYANTARSTAIGYVFLDGHHPTVALDTVTESRRAVRAANPDTAVTKQVFSLAVERAEGARRSSLACALVPNASERRLASYGSSGESASSGSPTGGPLSVLVNTVRAQAVRHAGLGIVAVNTFAPGRHRAGPLLVEGPASVILREARDGTVAIAVADPTTERDTVTVTIRGRRLRALAADGGVRVGRGLGGTRVEVTTRHTHGRSLTATLR